VERIVFDDPAPGRKLGLPVTAPCCWIQENVHVRLGLDGMDVASLPGSILGRITYAERKESCQSEMGMFASAGRRSAMTRSRLLAAMALASAMTISSAQTAGDAERRGSIPPGTSRDESRPAEGAIRGGSIEPDIGSSSTPQRDINRCRQLTGTLREQCLRDLGASSGGTQPPTPPSPVQRDPVTEPPPQNPR
jgi:hypothetical protein